MKKAEGEAVLAVPIDGGLANATLWQLLFAALIHHNGVAPQVEEVASKTATASPSALCLLPFLLNH
ncbi:hypothetical protein [Dendronalium sp. ChiSLP03b]|uniref:hypothetical protein n=1 Tax=Dendronalium sp. ChiSLP03b TaxID=3075381 RepID=UPI002AD26132|nr:hypothetical protein [Dendronalium sp. ChiSLP03b]MDZ8208515.1 hypothetical protein [Dendronalium sp. ChiSLP03b]